MKPIETGLTLSRVERSDAARLRAVIESEETLSAICPYQFEQPVAPLAAAQAERRTIDLRVIRQVYRCSSTGMTTLWWKASAVFASRSARRPM
jgi:dethiobiotin synthetase